MSNAKVIALLADEHRRLIAEVDELLRPISQELAQTKADIEQLQSAITPLTADLERLRAEVANREQGIPLE